jgi:predicted SAM-dependent methyltransferase
MDTIKLNLGSGRRPRPGYVNVDKVGAPDLRWDLEVFPWPWGDDTVSEINLSHVLEHLGATTEIYFGIWKEMYRVCAAGALVHITVPHPRHDDFMTDPTHVRAIGPQSLYHFSKRNNEYWIANGFANSPLAIDLGVDFQVLSVNLELDEAWASKVAAKLITPKQAAAAAKQFNNVVKQVEFRLRVNK